MADAEAAPEETGRQPLSAMWRSQGPSPSRVKVYNEEALLDLIQPEPAQGSRVSQTSSFLSRRKAQQRAEKKRQAKTRACSMYLIFVCVRERGWRECVLCIQLNYYK